MIRKPFTLLAVALLAFNAAVHIYRFLVGFQASAFGHELSQSFDISAIVINGGLAVMVLLESRR